MSRPVPSTTWSRPLQGLLTLLLGAIEWKASCPFIVVGIFTNDAAVGRRVGALMPGQADERAVSRRCLSPEILAKLTDAFTRQLAPLHG